LTAVREATFGCDIDLTEFFAPVRVLLLLLVGRLGVAAATITLEAATARAAATAAASAVAKESVLK
jgi:hypothetical protein